MRILVTGASGRVGGAIADHLQRAAGLDVSRAGRRADSSAAEFTFDLNDRPAVLQALARARPDVVIHAAGRRRGTSAELAAENVEATTSLVRAMSEAAPDAALVFLGSAAQYGPAPERRPWRESQACAPSTEYGRTKLEAENAAALAARTSGSRFTSLRVFNLVGPPPGGDDVLSDFLRKAAAALAGAPPWWVRTAPLGAVRDFVGLDDLLECVERTLARGVWGETINVCTGVGRPVRVLLEAVACGVGGLAIEERPAERAGELDWSVGDTERCRSLLGFVPSPDLTPVTDAAIEWLTAKGSADARSHA